MVILGLGSNIGDRLQNLRLALRLLKETPGVRIPRVSPVYMSDAMLPEQAPSSWNTSFLNIAVICETPLAPRELLARLQHIETQMGRPTQHEHWAPRAIDIDILIWDDQRIHTDELVVPHPHLFSRPFALWPLADLAPFWVHEGKTAAQCVEPWGSRCSGDAPYHTRQIFHRVDAPELVGVINVTPNSFADGADQGLFLTEHHSTQQAVHLVHSGATVIDLGAESTAPNATATDVKTEWQRLEPCLRAIHASKSNFMLPPKISIDTRHPEVAALALNYNIDWINDVSGLDDPEMRKIVAAANVDCVVMHHLSIPEDRSNILPRDQNPVDIVYQWAEQRLNELENSGISRQRIIFDPGIGFGKMAEQSLWLLSHVAAFQRLGVRILVGHSRKSFFSQFTDLPFAERDIETTAASLFLASQPVDYLRLHNVEICSRALKVQAALL